MIHTVYAHKIGEEIVAINRSEYSMRSNSYTPRWAGDNYSFIKGRFVEDEVLPKSYDKEEKEASNSA
jgi:hypothetical protein